MAEGCNKERGAFTDKELDFINAAFEQVLFGGGFSTNNFADAEAYELSLSILNKSTPRDAKKNNRFSNCGEGGYVGGHIQP